MSGDKHSPLQQFEISKLVDINLAGVDVSITNSTIFLFAVVFSIVLFFLLGLRKTSVVPSRGQAFVELVYEFVASMVRDNVGKEGLKYLPFIFSIFVLVLGLNLQGLIPYTFTVTSHIATTFSLALFCFIIVNIIGFSRHGLHFFHLFAPHGVPKVMLPIITPIEIISYLIRPISLGIRLAVAMTAGHIIIKIFAGFVISLGSIFFLLGAFPLVFSVGLVGMELLVSFIQAFIFSIMICIYLNDAVNMH
jgi:F-type H+-transporting ATPase subunit a